MAFDDRKRNARIRRAVRRVLSALPEGRQMSAHEVRSRINYDLEPPASKADVTLALAWNMDRGYVAQKYDGEEERDRYFLTERGRNKEAGDPEV